MKFKEDDLNHFVKIKRLEAKRHEAITEMLAWNHESRSNDIEPFLIVSYWWSLQSSVFRIGNNMTKNYTVVWDALYKRRIALIRIRNLFRYFDHFFDFQDLNYAHATSSERPLELKPKTLNNEPKLNYDFFTAMHFNALGRNSRLFAVSDRFIWSSFHLYGRWELGNWSWCSLQRILQRDTMTTSVSSTMW